MCRRFGFAFNEGRGTKERSDRRKAFVEHLLLWVDFAEIAEERGEGNRRWVVIETPAPIPTAAALNFARSIPRYVAGSFHVDLSL